MTVVVTSRSEQLGQAALQKLSDLQSESYGHNSSMRSSCLAMSMQVE